MRRPPPRGLAAGFVEWPWSLNRVLGFFPFFAAGVLFRDEIDRWFRAARRLPSLRLLPGLAFAAVYGFWFVSILRAPEPVYEGARIFNDVAYTAGYTIADRAMFYLIGLASALALIAVLGNVRALRRWASGRCRFISCTCRCTPFWWSWAATRRPAARACRRWPAGCFWRRAAASACSAQSL